MFRTLLFLVCLTLIAWQHQQVNNDLAVVERQLGIGIYVYALPIRDFDTVCVFKTKTSFNTYAGPSVYQKTRGIGYAIDDLARKAIKRSKHKKDINAIVTYDGRTAVGLRFLPNAKSSTVDKARVQQYKGYFVFVQNKPVVKYQVLKHIALNNTVNMSNTGYTSTDKMLTDLIALYESSNENQEVKANALITQNGVEADFVKLTE